MIPENYLDLQDIFVNEISGSMGMFVLLAMIFFMYLAARFRFPNSITFVFLILFMVVIGGASHNAALITISLVVVGFYLTYLYRSLIGN